MYIWAAVFTFQGRSSYNGHEVDHKNSSNYFKFIFPSEQLFAIADQPLSLYIDS